MTDGRIGLNERARQRIREEAAKRKLSHRTLAGFLNWGFNKMMFKLSGRTPMTLNEFGAICFAVGLQPTEAIRDRGLEFMAEMTPTELWLVQHFRQMPKPAAEALVQLLRNSASDVKIERRGVTEKRANIGKPRR